MENNIENKINFLNQFKNFLQIKKKLFIGLFFVFILIAAVFSYFYFESKSKQKKMADKYISAGVSLTFNDLNNSKKIYKEIILKKDKIYSLLALNSILENSLEDDKEEILKLFNTVENIKMDKEQKNLVKLKKALYLIKNDDKEEGEKLLQEIIKINSIWKAIAEDALGKW